MMGVYRKSQSNEIAQNARQIAGQQGNSDAVASHRQAQQNNSERHVTRQVGKVRMQPDGGEKPPPLAVTNRVTIHQTNTREVGLFLAKQVKETHQDGPHQAAPIENRATLKELSAPGPLVFFL